MCCIELFVYPTKMRKITTNPKAILVVTCNKCNTVLTDTMEIQECVHLEDTAGYGSRKIPDGAQWSLDLCQDCAFDLLSPFMTYEGNVIVGDGALGRRLWDESLKGNK